MTNPVDPDQIESIVGATRRNTHHLGILVSGGDEVSEGGEVYILHSRECLETTSNLGRCEFSIALDQGIHGEETWSFWRRMADRPVVLHVIKGLLYPGILAARVMVGEE